MRNLPASSPVDVRFCGDPQFKTGEERTEILSLIRQVVTMPGVRKEGSELNAIAVTPLTGGRNAAYVFKVMPLSGSCCLAKGTPIVIKILHDREGIREKANYDQFVRPMLPSRSRPELLGLARSGDQVALCYSFIGEHHETGPATLTDHLQRGDVTAIELFLRSIFNSLCSAWYAPHLIQRESHIALRYLQRYFVGRDAAFETETALSLRASRYFNGQGKGGRYIIGQSTFPSPHKLLFATQQERPYHSCVIHGDLNTDNILVAPDQAHMSLIDFQKTGRGHVYEDLVAVEASIRINYPPDETNYDEILESERLIALSRYPSINDPYATSIQRIRSAAFCHFGHFESLAAYHFSVAAIGLRLMQATDLSHVAYARITASTLWAAKILERLQTG